MSSMRNAVTRRPHKERAQPQAREKWGLLEKHKDYSLRAKDYNLKKKKLGELGRKAREKNPDEFAFGMLSNDKGKQGKHGRGSEVNRLSHDAVKLLKSQDAGYLRIAMSRGRRELEKVGQQLGISQVGEGKRTIFDEHGQNPAKGKKRDSSGNVLDEIVNVPSLDAGEEDAIEAETMENEVDEVVSTSTKPKSKTTLAVERDALTRLRTERKRRQRLQEMRVTKLEALKKRQKEIMAVADQLDLQRAKMAKTVGGVNKNGVKFKIRERKK